MKKLSGKMREKVLERFKNFEMGLNQSKYIKALSAVSLFDFLDLLRNNDFPENWSDRLMQHLDNLEKMSLIFTANFEDTQNAINKSYSTNTYNDFAKQTGKVYSDLWEHFSKEEYFSQTYDNLLERFEKNTICVNDVDHLLDAGCGGGRYSMALRKLGVKKVTGIDISTEAIALARRMSPFPESEVQFEIGSVLELPFDNEKFDFVFSNGVLHHTESTERGLSEIYRVLRKGGRSWLYLYGGKDSLFWDIVDLCRRLLADVPQAYTQNLMNVMGYPAGRIFHRCDFFYVPVHRRYKANEVEIMLQEAGFRSWRRLLRGTTFDWDELKNNHPEMHHYIYGEGEMRYYMEK